MFYETEPGPYMTQRVHFKTIFWSKKKKNWSTFFHANLFIFAKLEWWQREKEKKKLCRQISWTFEKIIGDSDQFESVGRKTPGGLGRLSRLRLHSITDPPHPQWHLQWFEKIPYCWWSFINDVTRTLLSFPILHKANLK